MKFLVNIFNTVSNRYDCRAFCEGILLSKKFDFNFPKSRYEIEKVQKTCPNFKSSVYEESLKLCPTGNVITL